MNTLLVDGRFKAATLRTINMKNIVFSLEHNRFWRS